MFRVWGLGFGVAAGCEGLGLRVAAGFPVKGRALIRVEGYQGGGWRYSNPWSIWVYGIMLCGVGILEYCPCEVWEYSPSPRTMPSHDVAAAPPEESDAALKRALHTARETPTNAQVLAGGERCSGGSNDGGGADGAQARPRFIFPSPSLPAFHATRTSLLTSRISPISPIKDLYHSPLKFLGGSRDMVRRTNETS